jgi:hypothetical protein
MNGSTVMQFLFQGYNTNLAGVVVQYATQILGAMATIFQGMVMLYIIILGHKMMFNALSWDAGATKMVRLIIVAALLTAANYQTFIATPVTQTIPNLIATTVTGTQGLQGAQGFDALLNQVQNFTAHARSQMVGLAYIGDRVAIWLIGATASIIVVVCFCIWSLAAATVDFLVPLGVYLFDATRSYAERWFGKIIALFLVMIITLMLGQVVVFQDAQYLQRFATAIAAAPPDNGFNLGAGAGMDAGMPFTPATPGAVAGTTINTDAALDTLIDVMIVFLYGLFLLAIAVGIALFIGGASGFSAAPAFNLASMAVSSVIRRR